ncbi:MAG: tripartite tricarboxylate transporter permease [Vicinamibacterales bacterium]
MVDGLQQVLTWPTPVYLLAGVLVGYVVGVVPGFGAPAALALVLPVTIAAAPTDGFVLLASVAAVSAVAGDITSILLGVPGEAASAAIVPDGHAMARQGLGGVAAGAALASACLGAVAGAIVLAVALPVSRPLLTLTQSPELAALAVLGLCLVTALSRAEMAKGLATGALGLVLATIGLDPSMGEPRFTFSQVALWDGLGLLPLALGLYAVPEALDMIRGRSRSPIASASIRSGLAQGCRAVLQRPGLVFRCSAIGAGIGMLPGVGATVSQWLAYAHASQRPSSVPFGEGAIEGVIGPATTTTATLGGALVPTLLLGIPGSVTSAFLLAALTFKGLAPGPSLLAPDESGGHLSTLWALVWSIVIATAIGAALSALSLGWVRRLAGAPPSRLLPFILMLVVIGTIGERHVMSDLGVLAALGVLGYAMSEHGWPRAPLMLGFVLGPLLERRWLLSQSVHGAWWLVRPGVLILAGLAALLLYREARRRRSNPWQRPNAPQSWRGDLALTALCGLLAAAALVMSFSLAPRAALFPRITAVALLVCAATCARGIRRGGPGPTDAPAGHRTSHLARLGWFWGFVGGSWLLGPVGGTALATALYARGEARAPWQDAARLTAAVGVTAYVFTSQFMPFAGQGAIVRWFE